MNQILHYDIMQIYANQSKAMKKMFVRIVKDKNPNRAWSATSSSCQTKPPV